MNVRHSSCNSVRFSRGRRVIEGGEACSAAAAASSRARPQSRPYFAPRRSRAEPAALDGVARFRGFAVPRFGIRGFDVVWRFRVAARSGEAGVQHPASQTPEPLNPKLGTGN